MKSQITIAIIVATALLSGCVIAQDAAHRDSYLSKNSMSDSKRLDIQAGVIRVGWTKEEVEASWGTRYRKYIGPDGETWDYLLLSGRKQRVTFGEDDTVVDFLMPN